MNTPAIKQVNRTRTARYSPRLCLQSVSLNSRGQRSHITYHVYACTQSVCLHAVWRTPPTPPTSLSCSSTEAGPLQALVYSYAHARHATPIALINPNSTKIKPMNIKLGRLSLSHTTSAHRLMHTTTTFLHVNKSGFKKWLSVKLVNMSMSCTWT